MAVALTVTTVTKDGEATWFEGVLLLSVYLLLALAFFFVTPRTGEEAALPVPAPTVISSSLPVHPPLLRL